MMERMFVCILVSIFLTAVLSLSLEELHAHIPKTYNAEQKKLAEDYWHQIKQHFTPTLVDHIMGNNTNYKAKQPYPYTSIEGLFPMSVVAAAEKEIPDNPQQTKDGCVKGSFKCFKKGDTQNKKNAFEDESKMGPATVTLFAFMKSKRFIHFLEKLTGIVDIIPDPEYRGSGIHQTLTGGHLSLHADFNRYEKYNIHRRVNCFIFLNPKWEDSYGGHLELWSKDLKSCHAKIRPDIGKFVVFSTTDFTYHGHPNPLTCPETRSRRSLALYYYTRDRPKHECIENNCFSSHSTIFVQGKCKECGEKSCAKYVYGKM